MPYKILIVLIVCGSAFAQGTPSFEVATVKPAEPITPQAMMAGKVRIGESIDGARADYANVNLEYLITKAYRVKDYQVTGPAWIKSERYDVMARLPEGAGRDQVPDMLKTLLKERFKLEIHRESKEHAVYALTMGKGPLKMKESPAEAPAPPDGQKLPSNQMQMAPGGDGRSMSVKSSFGNMAVTPGADGSIHMQMSQTEMTTFVDLVTRFVDKPVVDQTELKGKYEIGLDMSMGDMMTMARSAGMGVPGMGGGRGPAEGASDPSGGSIFQTVQALGLKLEPKKLPLEVIVVDKGEKTPTSN